MALYLYALPLGLSQHMASTKQSTLIFTAGQGIAPPEYNLCDPYNPASQYPTNQPVWHRKSTATYFSPSQARKPSRPHSDQGRCPHLAATTGSAAARLRCSEDCQGLRSMPKAKGSGTSTPTGLSGQLCRKGEAPSPLSTTYPEQPRRRSCSALWGPRHFVLFPVSSDRQLFEAESQAMKAG